ncbi:MAG: ATP-binding cassette domain-containing protein [Rhodobacteraceae bacterium]|nr:ATP-binding cassette domain-containing protein [Paracoccaceae bacterium]
MNALIRVLRLLVKASPSAMVKGGLLSVVVLLMGASLLGLSGWFITATGLAGVAGIGIAFDVFRPSAGVRGLALGRAAARYGERLLTHDATLFALAALRVSLLKGVNKGNGRELMQARSETALNRITADVDALDGLILRLFLPGVAALVTHVTVFVAMGLLVDWTLALTVTLIYLVLGGFVLAVLGRKTFQVAAAQETGLQTLRRGVIDTIRDREQLIVAGKLPGKIFELETIDQQTRSEAQRLDALDRGAGIKLSLVVAATVALSMVVGSSLVASGAVSSAVAAIAIFVCMALAETLLPLRRGFADLGRMVGAARRVAFVDDDTGALENDQFDPDIEAPVLELPELDVSLDSGQTLALVGPSGAGKTTLLLKIAGLLPAGKTGVRVLGRTPDQWPEDRFRETVAMVSQRSALIGGTIEENLCLAGDVNEGDMWWALETVQLDVTLRQRNGLQTVLGDGGTGLSGGETRRLALARAILKRPKLLLLDEPTEGLDEATEDRVWTKLRSELPDTVIVATTHRRHNHAIFDYELKRFC